MEPIHGRLRATLVAGKIPVTDDALTILSVGLSTIERGYYLEKAISRTAKTDTELKKDLSRLNMACRTVVDILDSDLSGTWQIEVMLSLVRQSAPTTCRRAAVTVPSDRNGFGYPRAERS
jgi:hypothetical protein